MKKFEVCIDIGDVISCQLRQFYNETGQYVRELSDAKHYMYDFFLQINLACVNGNAAEKEWTSINQHNHMSYLQSDILESTVDMFN